MWEDLDSTYLEIQKLSSESPSQKTKTKGQKVKDLDFAICLLYGHLSTLPTLLPPMPHHISFYATIINFSGTSRGPTTKCFTFMETSHDP